MRLPLFELGVFIGDKDRTRIHKYLLGTQATKRYISWDTTGMFHDKQHSSAL